MLRSVFAHVVISTFIERGGRYFLPWRTCAPALLLAVLLAERRMELRPLLSLCLIKSRKKIAVGGIGRSLVGERARNRPIRRRIDVLNARIELLRALVVVLCSHREKPFFF